MDNISSGSLGSMPSNIMKFKRVTLSETGTMAATMEYELIKTDSGVRISQYYGPWNYHKGTDREDCLEKRKEGNDDLYIEIAGKFDKLGIPEWNGFSKSASGVLDGYSFSFEAELMDGSTITAYGSNAYPESYRKVVELIRSVLG